MEHLTPPQQAFIKALISRPGDIDALISIGSMPESDIYNSICLKYLKKKSKQGTV